MKWGSMTYCDEGGGQENHGQVGDLFHLLEFS